MTSLHTSLRAFLRLGVVHIAGDDDASLHRDNIRRYAVALFAAVKQHVRGEYQPAEYNGLVTEPQLVHLQGARNRPLMIAMWCSGVVAKYAGRMTPPVAALAEAQVYGASSV
jgi:predicted membrane chloride channel (bestrophin family)